MPWTFVIVLAALTLTAIPAEAAPGPARIDVQAQPVPLDAAKWNADTVGQLRYRGGLHLTSPDKRFGGLSGLLVSEDGATFTAVSDRGGWIRGTLAYDPAGMLSDIADVNVSPLREDDGTPLVGNRRDAESLALAPGGGLVVAFERDPKLRIYSDGQERSRALPPPDGIEHAPANAGMEAVTLLSDGHLLVVTEFAEQPGRFVGWIGGADDAPGIWSRVTYLSDQGYKPTGATTLANGDVAFVERRFPLLSVRVRRAAAATLKPGAEIEAEELARLEGSKTFDNMEGIAARQGANGETLIYVVSDDNFRSFQRTLLMMFEVME